MFHSELQPAEPDRYIWFCVEMQGGSIRQHKLPAWSNDWTPLDWHTFRELQDLARRHGTHVLRSSSY
jgi:hypothetical protein